MGRWVYRQIDHDNRMARKAILDKNITNSNLFKGYRFQFFLQRCRTGITKDHFKVFPEIIV